MDYKQKLKIKPWTLPLEEVERMPGVSLEDLKNARYGHTRYPVTWYERYEDTPYGRAVLNEYLHRWKRQVIKNTVFRAELLRRVGKKMRKQQRGVSKRAYQHAAFWLYTSLQKYSDWVFATNKKTYKEAWAYAKSRGENFDPRDIPVLERHTREHFRTPRNNDAIEEIVQREVDSQNGISGNGKTSEKVR